MLLRVSTTQLLLQVSTIQLLLQVRGHFLVADVWFDDAEGIIIIHLDGFLAIGTHTDGFRGIGTHTDNIHRIRYTTKGFFDGVHTDELALLVVVFWF